MKFLRNFLILAIAGAVALSVLIRRSEGGLSPACDRADVQDRLTSIVADMERGRRAASALSSIGDVGEVAYDRARDLRTCAAVARFADGGQAKLAYTTEWDDRRTRSFTVLLQPYSRQTP
jgi:hypothetical protein